MNLRNYAYIGDAVWELHIRRKTVYLTNNARNLHELTTSRVKGSFQAMLLSELDIELTEEEREIARRGRNLPIPVARRANQNEYRLATAFETLIGWWYLHSADRLNYILNIIDEKFISFEQPDSKC